MNRHLMETQNLVISFDYSWFLAKNLAYAECPIMKFHYRNSSSADLGVNSKIVQIRPTVKAVSTKISKKIFLHICQYFDISERK